MKKITIWIFGVLFGFIVGCTFILNWGWWILIPFGAIQAIVLSDEGKPMN